jgi:uridine kinase
MDQVHDKAVEFIKQRLVQDTIQRFKKYLEQSKDNQGEKTSAKTKTILDPEKTHQVLPPAFMVAIGSVAGAGKTSLAGQIGKTIGKEKTKIQNDEQEGKENEEIKIDVVISDVVVLPMDGFHRYRSELSAMKDPEEAFRRRGAPYTFNDEKYAANMQQLRTTGKLSAPAFDHAKKDPEEDAIAVDVKSSFYQHEEDEEEKTEKKKNKQFTIFRPLVIVEGIYCLYDDGPFWEHALNQFDEKIYLKISIDNATERLTKRHMRAWGISEAEARFRASGSDRDNGLLVIQRAEKLMASGKVFVLESVEDEEFVAKISRQ